jgi:hypothetical protein
MFMQNVAVWFTLYELPVFAPNEFFWKNHVQQGEERWEAYARVIREIIA